MVWEYPFVSGLQMADIIARGLFMAAVLTMRTAFGYRPLMDSYFTWRDGSCFP